MEQREDLIKQILKQINQPLWSDWTIKEKIGVGSFSEVYRIEAERDGHTVVSALKIEPLVANRIAYCKEDKKQYIEQAVKLAENEINIMYQLRDCPNIVRYEENQREPFYYHGQFEGYYQLIRMELLSCVNDLLHKKEFELSENNVRKLAIEIGNGISAAHKKGIMHRDIKPGNLFISQENVYKLGDFNISKQTERANTIAGTAEYMAPEIYYKAEDSDAMYTKQTDIYSFGITLYYLMNGLRFPLEGTDMDLEQALVGRMSGREFPLPENASSEFGEIIRKACAYKIEERFQTVDEMVEAIRRLSEKEDVHTGKRKREDRRKYAEKKKKTGKRREKRKRADRKGKWIAEGMLAAAAAIIIMLPFQNEFPIIGGLFLSEAIIEKENIKPNIELNGKSNTEADKEVNTEPGTEADIESNTEPNEQMGIENNKSMEDEIVDKSGDFIIENGVLIKYQGNEWDVVIPDEVTDIGEKAFIRYENLESVKIPDSVKSIGFSAFAWCENLERVEMSNKITSMEKNAFRGCKRLESIVIPRGVRKIKMRSFQDCKSLEYVEFSEGLRIIGCLAFDGCRKLEKIELPDGVEKVDTWAFNRCKNLEKVVVLGDETKFLWDAFDEKADKLSIYCSRNSKAFEYAQEENISCFITLLS